MPKNKYFTSSTCFLDYFLSAVLLATAGVSWKLAVWIKGTFGPPRGWAVDGIVAWGQFGRLVSAASLLMLL